MLLRPYEMTEPLYNPINHLSQTELMEKFNLAFYEAQTLSKTDILTTFNDPAPETTDIYPEKTNDDDDYLIDYLISNPDDTPVTSPGSDADVNFDFNDFVVDFDQNVQNEDQTSNFDTETFTTESSFEGYQEQASTGSFCQFFVPPPFDMGASCDKMEEKELEDLDFANIALSEEELTTEPLDLDNLSSELQEIQGDVEYEGNFLPPVGTITKNNVDFNNFLRSVPADDIGYFSQVTCLI